MRLAATFLTALAVFSPTAFSDRQPNKYMSEIDISQGVRNYIHKAILQHTKKEQDKCSRKYREKQSKGNCGVKGEAEWDKCRRRHNRCKRETYEDRQVKRWLKMAACKCLDHPGNLNETKKEAKRRISYCQTWHDFLGQGLGRISHKKNNLKLLEAIQHYVRNASNVPACAALNYISEAEGDKALTTMTDEEIMEMVEAAQISFIGADNEWITVSDEDFLAFLSTEPVILD